MWSQCCCQEKPNQPSELVSSGPAVSPSPMSTEPDAEPMDKPEDSKYENDEDADDAPLVISVIGARGIRNEDWLPGNTKPSCVCEVKVGTEKIKTTDPVNDSCEPVWAEKIKVSEIKDGAAVELSLYDQDSDGRDFLGSAVLPFKDYESGFQGELKLQDAKVDQAYIRVKVKVAGKEMPKGDPPSFAITIDRGSKELSYGAKFNLRDELTLQLLSLENGAFMEYNKSVPPNKQIKPHDFIMRVNGAAGSSSAMLEEFKASTSVEVLIVRCVYVTVVYDRGEADSPLEMEFAESRTSAYAIIRSISGSGHNAVAQTHDKICAGDRIISVSGVKGKADEIVSKLKNSSGKVQMVLGRPATNPQGGNRPTHWSYQ